MPSVSSSVQYAKCNELSLINWPIKLNGIVENKIWSVKVIKIIICVKYMMRCAVDHCTEMEFHENCMWIDGIIFIIIVEFSFAIRMKKKSEKFCEQPQLCSSKHFVWDMKFMSSKQKIRLKIRWKWPFDEQPWIMTGSCVCLVHLFSWYANPMLMFIDEYWEEWLFSFYDA